MTDFFVRATIAATALSGFKNSRCCKLCLWSAIICLAATMCCAQAPGTPAVSGQVLDSSGATVPQALIRIQSTPGGVVHTATSGEDGKFSFQELPAGTYRLTVTRGTCRIW